MSSEADSPTSPAIEHPTRGVLEELSDERLVLSIPGTDYLLHLVPGISAREFTTPVGRRIKGITRARALRIHPARGGGRFIEPVIGMPRIVAGKVLAADPAQNQLIVDVTIPLHVQAMEGQDWSVIEVGRLVNFYVQSGSRFTPV